MSIKIDRRTALKAGAALAASQVIPAWAQDKPTVRFSAVFSEQDIRASMVKMFADELKDGFRSSPSRRHAVQAGNRLVALQRGNLEMGNIAPQDISKQVPAWSILTSAYLFRDATT